MKIKQILVRTNPQVAYINVLQSEISESVSDK